MKHYAGLDLSIKETSICIVDETGKVCREAKVVSHPEDLIQELKDPAWRLERVGLEAGPLSQWVFSGLAEAGLPVICIETRHAKAFLKAQVNKSDRNDARGIAQMMRVNLFRPADKPEAARLVDRPQAAAGESHRHRERHPRPAAQLWAQGWRRRFDQIRGKNSRTRRGHAGACRDHGVMLDARRTLREQVGKLHQKLLSIVREDNVCRRLMTIPGVGPIVSLAFTATIDIPARFKNSRAVGPALGLTHPQSIRREQPDRPDLPMRRRHDAVAALRSGASHADPHDQMVVAESLGDERRQPARQAKSHCRAGAPAGGGHASHVERRNGVPLD